MLAEARLLENQKDDLRSQFRAINARLRGLSQEGDELRARLGFNLQGKFGPTNEALIRFGFEPRRVTRRRSKAEIEAEKAKEAALKAAAETKAPAGEATPTGTEN